MSWRDVEFWARANISPMFKWLLISLNSCSDTSSTKMLDAVRFDDELLYVVLFLYVVCYSKRTFWTEKFPVETFVNIHCCSKYKYYLLQFQLNKNSNIMINTNKVNHNIDFSREWKNAHMNLCVNSIECALRMRWPLYIDRVIPLTVSP